MVLAYEKGGFMRHIILFLSLLFTTSTYAESFDTVDYVDLDRFMIPWYVQAHVPTVLDRGGINQIERYELNEKGVIETTFTFYKELGGKVRKMTPKATVYNTDTNAHWKMQFLWPFKHDYLIVRLAEDYSYTVVSVPSKSMIWIMTNTPQIDEKLYEQIVNDLREDEYPVETLDRVKQDW